jgi:hypothetical protein
VTKEFVQVRPDNGYLIHAVPADSEAYHTASNQPRWSKKGVICRKIQGRDAQRFPSLTFRLRDGERIPFTREELQRDDMPQFCTTCSDRVLPAIES